LLALDVGNTNTVVGLFEGEKLRTHWRLTTHAERTADEVGMWLHQLLRWEEVGPEELFDVAVSSVVPPMDPRLKEGVRRYLDKDAFFVEPGIRSDIPLLVDAPQELGADRLCDAVAAFARRSSVPTVCAMQSRHSPSMAARAWCSTSGPPSPGRWYRPRASTLVVPSLRVPV
jgi:type III pantothenate kinase